MIVALSFYGMSTFEGPMMSIKTVNALSHYTDWTVGHVHSGALGWVAMITIGCIYSLYAARARLKAMYSTKDDRSSISGSTPSAWCSTSRRCGSPASCRV
jgi:cytochrome c oxidase cbb3-type subunit 1